MFIILIGFLKIVLGKISDDIADSDYCKYNKYCRSSQHIGCLFNRNWWDEKCMEYINVTITEFDDELKEKILYRHNEYRNQVALGLLEGYNKAARMPTLTWDETLEYLSELNVRQCDMIHDVCRATSNFIYAGQNLCISAAYKVSEVSEIIGECIDLWFSEHSSIDQSMINKFRKDLSLPVYGHFTQMMIDRNNEMGCAMATFYDDSMKIYYYSLACDYSSTNIIGYPIYRSLKSKSECKKGQNPIFEGLCHPDEVIDPNFIQRN